MLERFYELKKKIKMAMVELDVPFDLSDKKLKKLMKCVKPLLPLKLLFML